MADTVRIDPEVLREVATQHDAVADQIGTARDAGDDIYAAVSTYGPIMHQVKAAVAEVLSERDAALLEHGSEEQKAVYLPKIVAGVWSGTMNLTEPHCGTDLGLPDSSRRLDIDDDRGLQID